MKERVISAIRVVLMLGICIAGITFAHIGNTGNPPDTTHAENIIILKPAFYDKPAEEGLWEALEYYNIHHKEIVYAQAVLETGWFKSKGCVVGNNLFGLKGKNYYQYDHWLESVIAYKEKIQNRYKSGEDYYNFLTRIHYAEDPNYNSLLKSIVKQKPWECYM